MEREPGAAGLNEIEADRRKWVKLLVVAARRYQKQEASCPAVTRDSKGVLNSSETNHHNLFKRFCAKTMTLSQWFRHQPRYPYSRIVSFATSSIMASPTGPKRIKRCDLE